VQKIPVSSVINKVPVVERQAFDKKVNSIAADLGVKAKDLYAIMDFESAHTMRPDITNKFGYVGLIQFGREAAEDLGTSLSSLKLMSLYDQLDYVHDYFRMWLGRLGKKSISGFVDLYLLVFYPSAVYVTDENKPLTGDKAELANPALVGSDGHITRKSIKQAFSRSYSGLFDIEINAMQAIACILLFSSLIK
jgi:hypothetical protein